MNIVIAPDSFKECLSASEVAKHISKGILKILPDATLTAIPISDGGEGLLESLVVPLQGTFHSVIVSDPLQRPINANYGILSDGTTAVIEMAKASGLELLQENEKNPLITSTYGTGELIKDALDKGCSKFIIGIGGSATNDAGTGMLQALGAKFLNLKGQQLTQGGGSLNQLSTIDLSEFDKRLESCEVIVACDVSNFLTGPNGASHVYGAQKGGSLEDLEFLDNNLKKLSTVISTMLHKDIDTIPGAGAAGGMGAGLLAFLNAKLVNGIALILETLQIEQYIKEADLVITGEGKIDKQTLHGKTIIGVAQLSKKHNVPVIVLTGKIGKGIEPIYKQGVTAIHSILNEPMDLPAALKNAAVLIESCTENVMRTMLSFRSK